MCGEIIYYYFRPNKNFQVRKREKCIPAWHKVCSPEEDIRLSTSWQ